MSNAPFPLSRRLLAEALGTAILVATVVGSGIMAERLAGGNQAVALLGNTIPTGAILIVIITILGPISGAHFNPAVTLVFAGRCVYRKIRLCNIGDEDRRGQVAM
jgi:glycerol uptake facilitator-like aquaporin